MSFWMWAPNKTVAARRADAERHLRAAAKRGKPMSPVRIEGRTIARTFWGQAWCDNLERYRDFEYRLDRGRSYVRSGSVLDLQVADGKISAVVSGSELYEIAIDIDAIAKDAWHAIRRDCAGNVGSRVDLLSGKLSDAVMARLCADRVGMFPAPSAIRFSCSCPDYAEMCKHVAAAMYGFGARLDHKPELLFVLRHVSVDELVESAVTGTASARIASKRVLAAPQGLAAMFGIEMAGAPDAGQSVIRAETTRAKKPKKKPITKPRSARPRSTKPKPTKAKPTKAKPTKA